MIQTIEKVLHIPINHYVAVDFPGFSGMVNALGGITMDFPTAVKDAYTGLNVTTTGLPGGQRDHRARSWCAAATSIREPNGYWEVDGLSDFSRIQRQDAFFRAVLAKVNSSITNPFAINSFIGAAVGNLTIDDTLDQGRPLPHRQRLPGPGLVAPHHRDAAHHGLHHQRRCRRAPGGPALRPEHDQRLQPDRRRRKPTRHAQVERTTTPTTRWPTTWCRSQVFNASARRRHRPHHRDGPHRRRASTSTEVGNAPSQLSCRQPVADLVRADRA